MEGGLVLAETTKSQCQRHLKALVFLYAFKESVDCHLLSSFCDDSNLYISLFKYVLSTMGVSKESISKFLDLPPIKNLLIDSLLIPIVESTYLPKR